MPRLERRIGRYVKTQIREGLERDKNSYLRNVLAWQIKKSPERRALLLTLLAKRLNKVKVKVEEELRKNQRVESRSRNKLENKMQSILDKLERLLHFLEIIKKCEQTAQSYNEAQFIDTSAFAMYLTDIQEIYQLNEEIFEEEQTRERQLPKIMLKAEYQLLLSIYKSYSKF